jgi:hypothetical protein
MSDRVRSVHTSRPASDTMIQLIKEVFKDKDRVTWAEFSEGLKANTRASINVNDCTEGFIGSWGRSCYRLFAERAGLVDECHDEDPVLVRSPPYSELSESSVENGR